jgi:outer membrane protein
MIRRLLTALGISVLCLSATVSLAAEGIVVRGMGETLEDFFSAALEYNPSLKIAEERWKIGSARRRAANGNLLPQINANTAISDNRQTAMDRLTTYRGERYSVQLTQVLFNWQAFSYRSQAYLLEDQAEAEYYAAVAWVLTDVADKYFIVLQAQDALASVESELDAIRTQAQQIQRLYDLRMAQITDLYDVQAQVAAVEAEQVDLQSQLALNREALRAASGLSVGTLYTLDDSAAIPALNRTIDEWVETALDRSHEIRARELALQVADKRISERRGAYMPRVSLVLQQQRSNLGFDNTPMARTDTGYVGVDVSIPLFAGGVNRAGVSEAISMHSIADSELRQIELDVSERTRTAYLRVLSGQTRTESARKVTEAMQLSSTARQRGFELGSVTSVDVLNALRDQYRAERELQRVRYDHIRASLLLRREAGTLTAEDMVEISELLTPPQR